MFIKYLKRDDIEIMIREECGKYRIYLIEPFGREKHLLATIESFEFAERAAELYFETICKIYEPMEDAVTKVAVDEALKFLETRNLKMPYGDIYPDQKAEQTNIIVKLCMALAEVVVQNTEDSEGNSMWWEK